MILGSMNVPRVIEKSHCRSSEPTFFTEIGDYKIHATALMPLIPFEVAKVTSDTIDSSIFVNSGDTKLTFATTVRRQNYLTTRYVGRAPLTYYGPRTPIGHEFVMRCDGGDPSYQRRSFGTEGAMGGGGTDANEMVTQPREMVDPPTVSAASNMSSPTGSPSQSVPVVVPSGSSSGVPMWDGGQWVTTGGGLGSDSYKDNKPVVAGTTVSESVASTARLQVAEAARATNYVQLRLWVRDANSSNSGGVIYRGWRSWYKLVVDNRLNPGDRAPTKSEPKIIAN